MALPPKVYQWLVGLFASLGSFVFGYDLVSDFTSIAVLL